MDCKMKKVGKIYKIRVYLPGFILVMIIEDRKYFKIIKKMVIPIKSSSLVKETEAKEVKIYIGSKKFLSQQNRVNENKLLNLNTNELEKVSSQKSIAHILISWIRVRAYHFLEKNSCIIMHASAVLFDDGVIIFSGTSGSGKSTIVKLIKGETLHDNEIIVKKMNNIFYAFSSPFASIKTNRKYNYLNGPIKIIYLLKKSRCNRTAFITKPDAFKIIFLNDNKYTHPFTDEMNEVFLNYSDLIQQVPVKFLYFRKDNAVKKVISDDCKNI